MEPRSIYYAHPMSWYGTDNEKADLQALRLAFPNTEIINPSSDKVEKAYNNWQRHHRGENPMDFFNAVVADSFALAYRPFSDGKIGAGVAQELLTAHVHGLPIWRLFSGCSAAICGAPKLIAGSAGDLLWDTLTIDETRARIKGGEL